VRRVGQAAGYGRPPYLKAALELRGLRAGVVRAPLSNLDEAGRAALQRELAEMGLLP
jgi:dihydrodipicolinate synthase/N-acetylneuraminate lyase